MNEQPQFWEQINAHGRFQIEVKREYPVHGGRSTRYTAQTYLFVPATLGISAQTYAPADFYRDLQNYVRLSGPRLSFDDLLRSDSSPLVWIEQAAADRKRLTGRSASDALATQLKLLHCSAKSAVQAAEDAPPEDAAQSAEALLAFQDELRTRYRRVQEELWPEVAEEVQRAFRLVDEALSLLLEEALLEVYTRLGRSPAPKKQRKRLRAQIKHFVSEEKDYRKQLPSVFIPSRPATEELMDHLSFLKKYAAEPLYLQTEKRSEGKLKEHLALAVAAGLAMSFATALAFYSQNMWSNFSVQLFLAFVLGYMFKDRIKEIARAWLAALLRQRTDDHRVLIRGPRNGRRLGALRERVRFISQAEVPAAVLRLRAAASPFVVRDERQDILLAHRKEVELSPAAFRDLHGLESSGGAVLDISRLDIRPFLRKMDDPVKRRRRLVGDRVETVRLRRTYSVYLITRQTDPTDATRTLLNGARVVLDRKGIRHIEPLCLDAASSTETAPAQPDAPQELAS